MPIARFVKAKAEQLIYYVRGFWQGNIPYHEINLFVWDTLEEWNQIRKLDKTPLSDKEQVFWHLIHQIHAKPPVSLLSDPSVKEELRMCVEFLEKGGFKPFQCIGIRP